MTTEHRIIHPKTRAEWFISGAGLIRKNLVNWNATGDAPLPGVRVCLFSTYNEKYDALAAIAEPNWTAYCEKHGYALRTYPGAFHLDPSRPETYGDKVKFSLYYDLRGLFDVVMFLDIDSLFVNMNCKIEPRVAEYASLFWTYAEGGPMSGLMAMRTDDRTEKHLRYAYEYAATNNHVRHGMIEPNGMSDQDAMTRLMKVPPFSRTFGYCFEAEAEGFCYPDTPNTNPWIVTCRGGSFESKLNTMRTLVGAPLSLPELYAVPMERSPAREAFDNGQITRDVLDLAERDAAQRPDNGHKMPAYNPRFAFDNTWAGPEDMKPRVYRTQSEKDTWYAVAVENEYRLPSLRAQDVVVDIGAHIGSFSFLAYRNGSRSLYGYEIDPWHLQAAVVNLSDCQDGAGVEQFAVVRGDDKRAAQYHYDGAWNSFGLLGPLVPSRSLDEIIDSVCSADEHVRFLKIDCEGGEYPILYTCTQIDRIDEIAGEWHRMSYGPQELRDLPFETDENGLADFLRECGFEVEITRGGEGNGGFWAKRPVALHRSNRYAGAKFGTVVKLS